MSIRTDLFRRKELQECWSAYRSYIRNNTAAGVDGVTKRAFDANINIELSRISRRVLGNDFGYQPLRPIPTDKGDGRIRLINVPTIADRFVQRCVLQRLLDANRQRWRTGISFGALGEESVAGVLKKVASQAIRSPWIIKSDISSYFDAIDRDKIKAVVRRRVKQTSLIPLIDSAIDCEPDLSNPLDLKAFRAAKLQAGKGIRQGMTLSPLLAYLFLIEEDQTTTPETFFRYVDDIIFFGKSKHQVQEEFDHYKQLLKLKGLDLSEDKTGLVAPSEPFVFLGIELRRNLGKATFHIPKKSKTRVLNTINDACDFSQLSRPKQRGWLARTAPYLRGLVKSYEPTYSNCEDWPTFKRQLYEQQKHACRLVVDRLLAARECKQDRKLLFRLFGVSN